MIGRIGGADGVALETDKWIEVLSRMGHEVHVITGLIEAPRRDTTILPALSFDHPEVLDAQERAFFAPHTDEVKLVRDLERGAEEIARGIESWIKEYRVGILISENANAIPMHLTMGMALRRVWERGDIQGISHDHDFAWERGDRYQSRLESIQEIVETCFPVNLPNVRHAVINKAARSSLKERMGCDATVVPNVMDFDAPFGLLDDYNVDLPAVVGLESGGLNLFQITRIIRRKGIETAIDLVKRLADLPARLVITGSSHDERDDEYLFELKARARDLGVEDRVLFAASHFDNERATRTNGAKVYSLSDGYAHASACTYFSTYEGFGNAFVEALVARRPIFVNDYQPVYWPDIGSLGFKTVLIRDGHLTDHAVDEARRVLTDLDHAKEMCDFNFSLGREHFSYQNLERILRDSLEIS